MSHHRRSRRHGQLDAPPREAGASYSPKMDRDDQVEILLKEYDALRTEIVQQMRIRFELVGVIGVVAGLVLTRDMDTWAVVAVALAGLVGCVWVWGWLRVGIGRCAQQLVQVERRVNTLAGADVLTWQQNQQRRKEGSPDLFAEPTRYLRRRLRRKEGS